ncbi:uncharacterized protein SETTUDRAFT_67405, partial [Exserohilum turcica Et28A]
APCLYVREIVDRDAQSPTPREAMEVTELLRRYIGGNDKDAREIAKLERQSRSVDTTEEDIKSGHHFFLGGLKQRAKNVLTFCAALENNITELDDSAREAPLPWTLKYLVLNAFQHLFPDRGFRLDSHVIFFCALPQECQIGEELISRSAQAYFEIGTGLRVTPAGISVS